MNNKNINNLIQLMASKIGWLLSVLMMMFSPLAIGESESGNAIEKAENGVAMKPSVFGKLADGTEINKYRLFNDNGTEIFVINYGAIITEWFHTNKQGKKQDIVLGFDTLQPYVDQSPYFGAVVGRYANRIAKGRFKLNGKDFQLATNNETNHLHGGNEGFNKKVWDVLSFDSQRIAMQLVSKVGDQGYPGEVTIRVQYELTAEDQLIVEFQAKAKNDTIINLAQHSYFNLSGDPASTILDHQLKINAEHFTPIDETFIPTGELRNVESTPFDFRKAKTIGKNIKDTNEQLKFGLGYDHNWVINKSAKDFSVAVAQLTDKSSGRALSVYSDQPGLQFYSGNFLDGTVKGKGGHAYAYRTGLCLETQHFPDSPNQPAFPSTVLRAGEVFKTKTIYAISNVD